MAAMENRLRKFATFTYLAGAGCVFLFLSTYLHGWASVTKLPPEAKTHLMTDDFKEISRVKDLPASLLAEFAEIAQNPNLQMANPDEKFQETDVIYEKGLPSRRLLWSALSSNYCVIHYEQGGIGHSYKVVLFKRSGNDFMFLWAASSIDEIKNLKELRQLLKTETLDDSLPYHW